MGTNPSVFTVGTHEEELSDRTLGIGRAHVARPLGQLEAFAIDPPNESLPLDKHGSWIPPATTSKRNRDGCVYGTTAF